MDPVAMEQAKRIKRTNPNYLSKFWQELSQYMPQKIAYILTYSLLSSNILPIINQL